MTGLPFLLLLTSASLLQGFHSFQIKRSNPPYPFQWSRYRQTATQTLAASAATADDDKSRLLPTSASLSVSTRRIAIPAAVGMLADPILGLIDTAYVGRLGANQLAAVGVCTSIFHLAFSTFRATTQATTSLVATHPAPRVVAATSLQASVVTGVLVATVLAAVGNPVLAAMGVASHSALYAPAACYLYTRLYFAPVVLYCGVAEGVFRGHSDTVTPLTASWVAAACNCILDPLLMFGVVRWGVRGAAIATAASQIMAALVYRRQLRKKGYVRVGRKREKEETKTTWKTRREILRAIASANGAALWKQMSLLVAWAYATACATRLGGEVVAAHQVGLSVWLVSAFVLDATGVAAQVLRTSTTRGGTVSTNKVHSYFAKLAVLQGFIAAGLLWGTGRWIPSIFTTDAAVLQNLRALMPHLAWTQIIVSLTLVAEGLAAGANQFRTLAAGTTVATIVSVLAMGKQRSIAGIWGLGIGSLFCGRFLTATFACWKAKRGEETPCA